MRHSRCFATSVALIFSLGFLFGAIAGPAGAKDHSLPLEIQFKDHRFTPRTLKVPAGEPLALKVVNASDQTIEFESFKLNREVAMTPGQTVTVRLPALYPGSYDFYDDFHQDVPEGTLIAR
ncbi:MAG TPA: cupredoxin domain-containing protein [Candidatus Binataceae bacterium]|nr:cupredoxin domain-containing protein [Candidatus Binataceae bacterium]